MTDTTNNSKRISWQYENCLSCKWFSPSDPINADILTNGRCVHTELQKYNLIILGEIGVICLRKFPRTDRSDAGKSNGERRIRMSQKISKILVAIDGSQPSISAAYPALEIAKQNNSETTALYISFIPLSLRFKSRDILDAAISLM